MHKIRHCRNTVAGRVAGGVKCITLGEGEYVVFAGQIVPDKGEVLMITNKGFCKRLPVKDIRVTPVTARGQRV